MVSTCENTDSWLRCFWQSWSERGFRIVTMRRVRLARARKAAGYTQEGLAEALRVDRSSVIRWEAGRYSPVPYLWPKLAKLLGVSRERLAELFADEEVKSANALIPVLADHGQAVAANPAGRPISPHSWVDDVNRREILRLLGVASTSAAVPSLLTGLNSDDQDRVMNAVAAPSRVDELTIKHVDSMLHAAMRQDDSLGPHAVLDTILAQRELSRTLLADCPSALRPKVLTLYSNLSRFAGWLSFDLTDYETASHYYEEARLAAHAAENVDLSICVLCNLSHLATWRGHARVGVDHAMAAQNWASETSDPLLRAYTANVAARAYAVLGNRKACSTALDNAQEDIQGAAPQTPGGSLVYFYGQGLLAATRSRSLLQLGDYDLAEQAARESLSLTGESFVRNRAFANIYLGNAHLAAGEIEQAAQVFGDGAELAARNRSARLSQTIHRARLDMRPWGGTPAVRDLDDKLVSYGLLPDSRT